MQIGIDFSIFYENISKDIEYMHTLMEELLEDSIEAEEFSEHLNYMRGKLDIVRLISEQRQKCSQQERESWNFTTKILRSALHIGWNFYAECI